MDKLDLTRAAALLMTFSLGLAGCATTSGSYAPLPLDPTRAAGSHVSVVRMTSGWVGANTAFADTFTDALHDSLRRCASGPGRLDLRVHVDQVRRAERWTAALDGGQHELAAVAEFVDPASGAVVGRYPIQVAVDAGGPVEALLADRQLMVSQAFADALCTEAFGR